MALITAPRGRFACTYWHVDQVSWDKADNTTSLLMRGYLSREDRVENFPKAADQEPLRLTGYPGAHADIYAQVQAMPAWADAQSDTQAGQG